MPSDQEQHAAEARASRLFEVSKSLDDDAFRWFVSALCHLNAEMIGIPTSELGQQSALQLSTNTKDSAGLQHHEDHPNHNKQPKRTGINVMRTLVYCR